MTRRRSRAKVRPIDSAAALASCGLRATRQRMAVFDLLRADRGPSSWECVSTDIASIASLLPDCAFAPRYVPPVIQVPPLQPPWRALYEGTVGGSPVVALFCQVTQTTSTDRDPTVAVEGLYYYRRRARTLALLRAPARGQLVECPGSSLGEEACPQPTGIWQVDVTENRVTGTWRASSDRPSKSVKLTRRAAGKSPDRDPCDIYLDMPEGPLNDVRRAILTGKTPGMKLIHFGGSRYSLFDLAADPAESKDLAQDPETLRPVMSRMQQMRGGLNEVAVGSGRR
jgi:hypothetical protein